MSHFHFVAVSIFYAFSRVMDSKWGGKTETINMKLNVEQVQNKMTMKLKQMTHMHNFKQLLDEVFVISGIIKVEGSVISRSRRLRLITLTETLIIPDITKTESNNCFIILYLQVISQFLAGSMKRIEKPFLLPCPRT